VMIETAKATNRIIQIGSQRVSSVLYAKAKELLASGAIGKLNMVTASWDRNSSMGAWNYTIPPDASVETCDWPRFLGTAPKIPFSAEQFFQWRKWNAYGSGVAGDLFVHLFSGTHFITGSHGPTRGMATGAIRFWNDGRNADDVMLGLFDYREGFNLSLRVNFVDGGEESESLIFTGSEGTIQIGWTGLTLNRVPRETEPGLTIDTFPKAMQAQIEAEYRRKYPPHSGNAALGGEEKFILPKGYSDQYDHFRNFFGSVRTRKQVVEDAVFGYRAAGAALLSNLSIEKGAIVKWDPDAMKVVEIQGSGLRRIGVGCFPTQTAKSAAWMGHPASGAEYWKSNCRFLDSRWSLGMTVLNLKIEFSFGRIAELARFELRLTSGIRALPSSSTPDDVWP